MKKILLGFLLQIAFTTINAQETKVPTKQETMDWIAKKLKESMEGSTNKFISYQNGLFKFRMTYDYVGYCYRTLNMNKISSLNGCISVYGINLHSWYWETFTGTSRRAPYSSDPNEFPLYEYFEFPEDGLCERLEKAFSALVDFYLLKNKKEPY